MAQSPHNLLIITVPTRYPVSVMDELAEKLAKNYHGTYDGNGIGFGKIDEYIYFARKSDMENAARHGILSIISKSDKYPKTVSYHMRDTREKIYKSQEGHIKKV